MTEYCPDPAPTSRDREGAYFIRILIYIWLYRNDGGKNLLAVHIRSYKTINKFGMYRSQYLYGQVLVPFVNSLVVLDADGDRLLAKYYDKRGKADQTKMEQFLHKKTKAVRLD